MWQSTLDTFDGPEDDDPPSPCEEDGINTDLERASSGATGCEINNPDHAVDDKPCDEPYQEREQMAGDVPTVPCFGIKPDEAGKRAFVGYWNPAGFIGDCRPA